MIAPMPAPQNFNNHTRFDPPFHFFLLPLLLINFGLSIYYTIHQWPEHSRSHLWWIVMSVAVFVIAGKARGYALAAQDRTIRLEERLRFAALLSPAELAASNALAMKQYVALRFASDAEVPALIRRTLAESLTPKQIKQSIETWRPDYDRV
jgi:hypothetical protein